MSGTLKLLYGYAIYTFKTKWRKELQIILCRATYLPIHNFIITVSDTKTAKDGNFYKIPETISYFIKSYRQ